MAAIDSRKKVRESAEASVAYLMKIALVPNEIDAIARADMPLERFNSFDPFVHNGVLIAPLSCPMRAWILISLLVEDSAIF